MGEDRAVSEDIELELTADPDARDVRALGEGLARYNRASAVGGDRVKTPLAVWMRRDGQVLGGAYGDTHYGWLYLSL